MILFQYLLGISDILMFLAHLIPRHLKHRLDIGTYHTVLRLASHGIAESADLFAKLLLHLVRRLQLIRLLLEFIRIRQRTVVSELLPDQLRFLAEDIFPLVLIHTLFDFRMDLILDIDDLNLVDQLIRQQFIAPRSIRLFQQLLHIRVRQRHIRGDRIDQLLKILRILYLDRQLFRKLGILRHIFLKDILHPADHTHPAVRLTCLIRQRIRILDHRYIRPKIRFFKFYRIDARPDLSRDQDPIHFSW